MIKSDQPCQDATEIHSYICKLSILRWPVLSCINFSGTFASNKQVAPVARRLWFVLPFTPICSHVFHHGSQCITSNRLIRKPWYTFNYSNFPVDHRCSIFKRVICWNKPQRNTFHLKLNWHNAWWLCFDQAYLYMFHSYSSTHSRCTQCTLLLRHSHRWFEKAWVLYAHDLLSSKDSSHSKKESFRYMHSHHTLASQLCV